MDTILTIEQIIISHNFKCIIDDTAIDSEMITKKLDECDVLISTSHKVICDHDSFHPERIICILFKKLRNTEQLCSYVIPNNREIELNHVIPYWLNKNLEEDMNCCICYSENNKFWICVRCCTKICLKCFSRVCKNKYEFQCPMCRYITLSGDSFGFPWKNDKIQLSYGNNSINQFITIIKHLDGLVKIIPRINNHLMLDGTMTICRLTNTNRYSDSHLKIKNIRKMLTGLVKHFGKYILYLYTVRKTFHMDTDTNKRVNEISLFQITNDYLIQIAKDSWDNIFDEEYSENLNIQIEYIEPHIFTIPIQFQLLYNEINNKYKFMKIFMVIDTSKNRDFGFDFNVDKNGRLMIMNIPKISRLTNIVKDDCFVMCMILEEQSNNVELISYHISNNEYKKLSSKRNKKLFHNNSDKFDGNWSVTKFL